MNSKMRVAVMGAGAVGGYFGGRLAAAGQEVAFIARGKHLEAMKKQGLQVKSPKGDLSIRSLFTSDPREVGPVDLILFCVKSYDTEEAAKRLAPMMGDETIILSLQNGVDNPERIAAVWGRGRTRPGVVFLGARVSMPGMVEHSASGQIVFGELSGEGNEKSKAIQELFLSAQVPCTLSAEIQRIMWKKLLWNAPICAISCLTRATVKEILESDSLKKLATDCMGEVREAGRAQGVDLNPSDMNEVWELSRNLGNFKPSMLQDLEAGKPLEYEALNGIVVRLLREAGKEAPVNQIFYAALKFLDNKIRAGA